MSASDVISLIGGGTGGTAIVLFTLWLTGLIHTKAAMDEKNATIQELKEQNRLERQRADSAVITGQVVRDVMISLHKELE